MDDVQYTDEVSSGRLLPLQQPGWTSRDSTVQPPAPSAVPLFGESRQETCLSDLPGRPLVCWGSARLGSRCLVPGMWPLSCPEEGCLCEGLIRLGRAFACWEALPTGPHQLQVPLSEEPQTARGLLGGVDLEGPWL